MPQYLLLHFSKTEQVWNSHRHQQHPIVLCKSRPINSRRKMLISTWIQGKKEYNKVLHRHQQNCVVSYAESRPINSAEKILNLIWNQGRKQIKWCNSISFFTFQKLNKSETPIDINRASLFPTTVGPQILAKKWSIQCESKEKNNITKLPIDINRTSLFPMRVNPLMLLENAQFNMQLGQKQTK